MTREEAIKNIKEQMDLYVWQLEDINKVVEPRRYEQYRLAIMSFEMAIKALEQQPCEDCISREKAKQFLYERIDRLNDNELYDIFSRIIDDMYNELPSVTPQQKIGYWTRELIINEYGGCIGAKMICSECGQDNGHDKRMKFCPNCGAKMEVGE